VNFELLSITVEEQKSGSPKSVATKNAELKLEAALKLPRALSCPVLAADTVVDLDTAVLGKPTSKDQARDYIKQLSGRSHRVFTTLAVSNEESKTLIKTASTTVKFKDLSSKLIDWYVDLGEWSGRAGGYAVQQAGAALISQIEGDYTNVVGLPIPTLLELLPGLLFSSGLKR